MQVPLGQDFTTEYQLYEKFVDQCKQYFGQRTYGIVFRPADEDAVVVQTSTEMCDKNADTLIHELDDNNFVVDFEQMKQEELSQKLMFRITKQLNIRFSERVEQFNREKEEIIKSMDPKKLKQF